MLRSILAIALASLAAACGNHAGNPAAPTVVAHASQTLAPADPTHVEATPEQPPFNLEAILRGDGFGLVKFRQQQDPTANIVNLDAWVRDLLPDTSYSLQRAVDTTLDDVCTSSNWLTLGKGLTPEPIVTDATGTGRAELWRDLSALPPGSAFDIHFRVIENATSHVALQSGCYRFVVRD